MPEVSTSHMIVSLNGAETFDLFQQPFVQDADFSDILQQLTNVPPDTVRKQKFYRPQEYISRPKNYCEFTPVGATEFVERDIQTYYSGIDQTHCIRDLANTEFMFQTQNGNRREEVWNTMVGGIIVDSVQKSSNFDRKAQLWWGRRKNPTNAFQGACDGFWGWWIPYFITQGEIANTTSFANATLGLGDALDLLEQVYKQSNQVVKSSDRSMLVYYVDQNVYDQLHLDYAATVRGSVIGEAVLMRNDATNRYYYRGIEVRVAPLWAQQAQLFFPTAYTGNPNLCLLTHKRTLWHLTDVNEEGFDIWYDRTTRQNKLQSRWSIGTTIAFPEFVSTACNH